MISLTVNGIACPPALCQISTPAWTFTGNVLADGNVFDTNFALQSITPPGAGGHVTIVATLDVDAASMITALGGVNLDAVSASASTTGGRITETIDLDIGANQHTGGDFLGTWTATPPPQCVVGVPPDCSPPQAPPVPLPTLGEWGVLGLSVAIALAAVLHWIRGK